MNFSFKYKLFITFVFYGLVLLLIAQSIIFLKHKKDIQHINIQKASEKFVERDNYFKSYIEDVKLKLFTIQNSAIFQEHINDKTGKLFLLDITNTAENIMQLRYIDANGMEKIRVQRDTYGSKPYLIEDEQLQNKKNRYYFQEVIRLKEGQFWYSKLDLNMEHGKIELPRKPVLRVGTPLFHNGKKVGILIVNIFMKKILNDIVNTPLFDIYLIDKDGYILTDPHKKSCWNRYLGTSQSINECFDQNTKDIVSKSELKGENFYSKKIFLNNGEDIRMVLQLKDEYIEDAIEEEFYKLLFIMLVVILISFPFSYFVSIRPSRLKDKVDTEIKEKTKELQEINENLEKKIKERTKEQDILLSLFDLSDAVLFKWNNDENWTVNSVSKSVESLLEYTPQEFINGKIVYAHCIHHDDLQLVMDEVTQAINEKKYFFKHEPYRVITKSNKVKWILDNTVIVRDENDNIINFVGYLTDITALKTNELKLKNLSITDQLTKIHNRMYIDEMLQNQYYRFHRNQEISSIILLDIDFFKSINDKYGHLIGDMVLVEFATLLKSSIRKGDTVGRWGGEEFLIILPHANLQQALKLAQKIRKTIENNIFTTIKHITASFGVATFEKGMSIENLIDTADKALYLSKENGRNKVTTIQEVKGSGSDDDYK